MVIGSGLRQRLWRWHFFAGLIVCPFAILLSITGSIYLFKPQIDSYVEGKINATAPIVDEKAEILQADQLVSGLLDKYPNATFKVFTQAKANDRTVEVELRHASGQLEIFWIDQLTGQVLDSAISQKRFLAIIKDLHGELLLGNRGSYVVELMASWMIILIITGVYLWLGSSSKKTQEHSKWRRWFVPQLRLEKVRSGYKNLHGVIGIWFTLPILVLLLSGLPWTQLWGSGFKQLQDYMGWEDHPQFKLIATVIDENDLVEENSSLWEISSDIHAHHFNASFESSPRSEYQRLELRPLTTVAEFLINENLVPPVHIYPPNGKNQSWSVQSMSQQRSQRVIINFDPLIVEEVSRIEFADRHPVKRLVSHGISLHEGALFGLLNQLLGLMTAIAIIALSSFGLVIGWLRRPRGELAPPPKVNAPLPMALFVLIVAMGLLLPAAGISFVVIALVDRCLCWFRAVSQKAI